MKTQSTWILVCILAVAGGSFFRVWRLNDRPMHTDEAVHAEKFSALLEKGCYVYDPEEYHGPTLNYFTLVSAFLRGEKSYAEINETTLRLVPAVFGIGLILTPLFFLNGLSRRAVVLSIVLIAFSPAFVYYSRYYIQEMLLVFYTASFLGGVWKYVQTQKIRWLVLTGISAGLMHASKETFVFSLCAAFLALFFSLLGRKPRKRLRFSHFCAAVSAMLLTSALFYSSFGTNLQGIQDSISTYGIWFKRAAGESVHIHPWYYYLDLLTWLEFTEPITWNEDGIVALGAAGLFFTFFHLKTKSEEAFLLRFIGGYSLILTIIYALIPYKTPWCMLSFLYGMVLLAGIGTDWLLRVSKKLWEKICVGLLIVIFVIVGPMGQSWMLNFRYASDPVNPYAYAHTSTDIFPMVEAIKNAVAASEAGKQVSIYVIAAGDDYWPLPWYLRTCTQVGYWSNVDSSAYTASVILANAQHEQEILKVLYSEPQPGQRNLYMPLYKEYLELRPDVEWRAYIRKDLWDRMNTEKESVPVTHVPNEDVWISQPDKKQIENLLKFSHQAMNTDFAVFIQDPRGTYAGQAARAAFCEVDRLEGLLSRFIENSDVSRINSLMPGEEIIVDEDTFRCLEIARQAYQITDGAFDVTIGDLITARKKGESQTALAIQAHPPTMKMIELDADRLAVRVTDAAVNLDLGGIGKGYAVDKIAEILSEWGIDKALIHGGGSSVRALTKPFGKSGWPITLTNPIDRQTMMQLQLENEVFSCSGLQGGEHIIDPFTGRAVKDRAACWVRLQGNASLADALTTAGMIMPLEKLRDLPDKIPDVSLMLLMVSSDTNDTELLKVGK